VIFTSLALHENDGNIGIVATIGVVKDVGPELRRFGDEPPERLFV
jgi:hypothetical protein